VEGQPSLEAEGRIWVGAIFVADSLLGKLGHWLLVCGLEEVVTQTQAESVRVSERQY